MSQRNNHINRSKTIENIDRDETEANAAISDLIANITILTARKDPLIKSIKSPKLLIRGLTELQSMIEMVDIKRSIVNQIKFLITNHARKQYNQAKASETSTTSASSSVHDSHFEGHMLHSVISGNPGTGKTTVGMILAKIWMALGFVNKSQSPKESSSPVVITNAIVNTVNESYRKRVRELEETQRNDRRRLDRIRELLSRYQTTCGEIRRRAIRLRPNPEKAFPDNLDSEWDAFFTNTREMRFGFDEIIREANIKDPITTVEASTPIPAIPPPEELDPYENMDPKFIVAAREDFIAEYLGQTAPKTKKVLESAKGGVLFIDEAYALCNMDGGSKDKYGEECLTTINEFMSLYPDEIIIIFAGYKDKLMSSIFKAQPGLLRRCVHFFEIKDYTPKGMAKIFSRQLARNSWFMDSDVNIEKILEENKDLIQDGGGGTERLAFFVKIAYGNSKFEETVNADLDHPVVHDSVITQKIIDDALSLMRKSSSQVSDDEPLPHGMYL
jgi:hypothetical protein